MATEPATPSAAPISAKAYLSVIGGTSALFCSVGFFIAFGVFQEYYKEHLLLGTSDFDISWIGSASVFLLYMSAPVCGVLVDKIGPKILLVGGSIGVLISIFMMSLCSKYYEFFLAQAVLLGISMGFITWPPMAVVSRHLPQHRGLALGIVTGGSSVGGIIWPIMIEQLLTKRKIGFPWTMRVVGFTMMPLLAIACISVMEPSKSDRPLPASNYIVERDSQIKPSLFRSSIFISLCIAFGLGFLGLFIPYFYISSFAAGHGASTNLSFYMISIVNAASLFGRVIPGYLADRFGHYNLMILLLFASGVIAFCWAAVSNLAGIVVWSAAYGFFSGAILSLQGACVGKIATPQNQGKAIGFLQGTLAVTVLVGSPIGSQLLAKYGYLALSMFTGSTLVMGSIVMIYARLRLDSNVLASV